MHNEPGVSFLIFAPFLRVLARHDFWGAKIQGNLFQLDENPSSKGFLGLFQLLQNRHLLVRLQVMCHGSRRRPRRPQGYRVRRPLTEQTDDSNQSLADT